ncbi:excalibur calcium-binding domain-containing protein [Deinococcus arenicola]|uniref:Excalibur calcium-binding domain-containing protein n=1 Tax=Deinococcus arenicola TaxID=2994950 RepID=A0ABU4DVI4_9DEIO|nr:excalibur calcium-binding domain-containing protein [Deinococcus sp. ZS9-10]MDV6376452.1 excalibur calcium-binding domain-containing protein [Deinococcus sp. ZS9-10]
MRKKLTVLAALLTLPAAAVAASETFAAPAKVALMMLGGTRVPCQNLPPNTPISRAACATVSLDAPGFKSQWSMVGELPFTNLFIVSDWTADAGRAGSFWRAYSLDGKPLVVSYQPMSIGGRVALIYSAQRQAAPVLPGRVAPALKFQSCEAALAAGYRAMRRGEPGYSQKLDPDKDGIACDK